MGETGSVLSRWDEMCAIWWSVFFFFFMKFILNKAIRKLSIETIVQLTFICTMVDSCLYWHLGGGMIIP